MPSRFTSPARARGPEAVHHAIQRSLDVMAPMTSWQCFKAKKMPEFMKEHPEVKRNQFKIISQWMSEQWDALSEEEKKEFKVLPKNEGGQDQTARARRDRSRSPRKASGTPAAIGGADQSKPS